MKKNKTHSVLLLLSAFGLIALLLFTSPVNNILYAIVFFVLLLIFLLFLIKQLYAVFGITLSVKKQRRLNALAVFAVLMMMFRSIASLSWIMLITLGFISLGLIFYWEKRQKQY